MGHCFFTMWIMTIDSGRVLSSLCDWHHVPQVVKRFLSVFCVQNRTRCRRKGSVCVLNVLRGELRVLWAESQVVFLPSGSHQLDISNCELNVSVY